MRTTDIFIPHPSFERHLTRTKNFSHANPKISSPNNKRIFWGFKCHIQLESIISTKTKYQHASCAVANFERGSTDSISNSYVNLNLNSGSDLNFETKANNGKIPWNKGKEHSAETIERISQANKGKTPWNKGRQHSAETIQRIRERTKIAMQNPKIKKKLAALGHAQSEETRVKIGEKMKEGWKKRREMLALQEIVLGEWQNLIADVARLGISGQHEFQWNSYQLIKEEIKKELKEIEKRERSLARRAPKSIVQKMKIAESIKAKWADPDNRERYRAGMMRHHHTRKMKIKEEKDKLRRSRISQANKGRIPWNKGKKHSAETIERIKVAMPKNPAWEHAVQPDRNNEMKIGCVYCDAVYTRIGLLKRHLAGGNDRTCRSCPHVPDEVRNLMRSSMEANRRRRLDKTQLLEEQFDGVAVHDEIGVLETE